MSQTCLAKGIQELKAVKRFLDTAMMLYMHVDVSDYQMAFDIPAASSIDSTVHSKFKPHL
jgi:hypothetical protein